MTNASSVGNTFFGTSYEEYKIDQRVRKTELGKNDFLNLLVAQLQYQDPLEPTKDSDFVAQLAQFSALEQMEAMSSSMAMMQAYDLVGKFVFATDVIMEDGGRQDIGGFVDSVVCKNGVYYAQIGDIYVSVARITEVYDKDYISSTNPLLNTAQLIGRYVSANIMEGEGDAAKPCQVSGLVTRVSVEDGIMVAYLKYTDADGYTSEIRVPVSHIYDIREAGDLSPLMNTPEVNYDLTETDLTEIDLTDSDITENYITENEIMNSLEGQDEQYGDGQTIDPE